MIRALFRLFSMPPNERERERRKKKTIDLLIQRYARGNIRLREGRYRTKEDMEREKGSVLRCSKC